MKNTLLSDLGEYFPSFFRMKLSFAFYDNPIAIYRLPPKERGTFIHEYIHFLQDISTHFGLNNMYVYSEYLHSTITQLYKEKKKEIKIPIDPYKQSANLLSNIEINNLCTGDYKSRETLIISDIKEKNYKLKNRNKIIESIPIYQLKSGKEFIHFGGRAIMESMAFLIEQALEPLTVGAKDYPYHAAQNVSDYYIPNFSSDPGRLIALCDVALLMSNPAHLFISYLKYYKHQNIIPSAKDIYDKFYTETHFFSGKPCYAREGLLSFFPTIANYLSTYVHPTLDKGFSTITNFLISKALNFRINRPFLIYELFSAGPLLYNHIFTNILKEFGSPLIQDKNFNYSIYPPIYPITTNSYFLESFNVDDVHSLGMWTAIEQIYNTFFHGYDCCEMVDWCEQSKNFVKDAPMVDERCYENPWKRCRDLKLCPYGLLWKHWNLSKIKISKRM